MCSWTAPTWLSSPPAWLSYEALEAGKALKEAGISARIINMATIKPLDEELVLKAAQECGKIITCEEHSVIGGLGEAVCALTARSAPPWCAASASTTSSDTPVPPPTCSSSSA